MLFKLSGYLLSAVALFSVQTLSMADEPSSHKPSIRIEYELPPHQPMLFANFWFTKVTAICVTEIEEMEAEIDAELILKKGEINGVTLDQGDSISMIVHPDEKLVISADSGAKVRITNHSGKSVKAYCYNG